jgi:hypothetical protein
MFVRLFVRRAAVLVPAALIGAALVASLRAQDAEKKGREVANQVIAALGGDRFLHMQNRVSSGRIYGFFHDRLSGLDLAQIYVEYLDAAPKDGIALRERELLGKKRDYSFLFLPTQGWDVTYRGARPIPDEDWDRYIRTNRNDILYMLRYRLNEPGMEIDYIGTDIYLSRHVEVMELTDASNQTVRVYLDHNTMLPIHQTFSWLDEKTRMHNDEATEFDKYRDAGGGVMWPFSVERSRNGYKVYQQFAEQVQVDQSLPPRVFDLPPGAKLLNKVN